MKTIFSLLLSAMLSFSVASAAEMQHENLPTPEAVVQELRTEQKLAPQAEVDCTKVSSEQFEKLGDSVMETVTKSSAEHERMEELMGGEQASLVSETHLAMGRNFLKCPSVPMKMGMGMMENMKGSEMMEGGKYKMMEGMSGDSEKMGMMQGMMSHERGVSWSAFHTSWYGAVIFIVLHLIGCLLLLALATLVVRQVWFFRMKK